MKGKKKSADAIFKNGLNAYTKVDICIFNIMSTPHEKQEPTEESLELRNKE